MKLTQAVTWGLVLGSADAQFRALRRDSGLCSMEIVATVTKTYTVTSSEEVVVPCNTAGHGSKPVTTAQEAKPTASKPSAGGDDDEVDVPKESSSTADKPSTTDGGQDDVDEPEESSPAGEGPPRYEEKPDAHPSELPFESLIPTDYFPDITISEPPATSTSSPSSSFSSSGSSDAETSSDDGFTPNPTDSDNGDCEGECTTVIESVTSEYLSTVTPPSDVTSLVSTISAPSPEETPSEDSTFTPEPSSVETETPEADETDCESSSVEAAQTTADASTSAAPEPETTSSPAEEEAETTSSPAEEEPEPTTSSESSAPATSTVEEEPEATSTTIVRNFPADIVDELQDDSMDKLKDHLKRNGGSSCTLENAAVRREWSDLSIPERQDYLKAVQCLQNKPAKTPANIASGAKSRFDDFVVTHIQQTNTIHNTANFLSWHRYFTWAYETALRDECGYKGFQPYWNWARYASDPVKSPIFNGNATSFGGNSVNGGCASTGPFDKLNVNLGPGNSLRYNPRCLKRDVSGYWAQQCTADKTMAVINERTIVNFQDRMQYSNGIHAGGHFTMGGDPGGDVFTSPGDPVFYLHHAMIDRVWWIWQLQDLDSRLTSVGGRVGGGSNRQGSLQDNVNLGLQGGDVALGELLNTMGGKSGDFCYIYV